MIYKITKFGKAALIVGAITVLLLFIMNTEVHFHPFTFHIHEAEKLMLVFLQVCGFLFFDLNGQCAGFKRGLLFATEMLERKNEKREKEGEQKPTDKVEPKFKIGDWIIDVQGVSVNQIIGYEDDSYLIKTSCSQFYLPMKLTEKNYHLWTIQDAKDGDVLVCKSGWTCIFKTLVNDETFSSYCFMDDTKWFCETGSECHTLKEEFAKAYNGKIHPATKEQRDILEKAMADAGYTFDFEKKELRKIEQKPTEWSEEDENINECIQWTLIDKQVKEKEPNKYNREINWLKSLRPQKTWRPSNEQMKALWDSIPNNVKEISEREMLLDSLYQDLKKLMEE